MPLHVASTDGLGRAAWTPLQTLLPTSDSPAGKKCLGCLVFPCLQHKPLDNRRLRLRKRDSNTDYLASPEQLFNKLRVQRERLFPLLFRDEDMDMLMVRRHGDEDLATYTKRTELMMRLLGHFG